MKKYSVENILKDKNYVSIVEKIINHEEFQRRKTFKHHGKISTYEHCLRVSYLSYKVAKRMKADEVIAALGGLFHDFHFEDWHNEKKRPFFKKHGFTHAKEASINAEKHFPEHVNKRIKNCIARHMFPLNPIPPKYVESWIVTIVDKAVSMEIFKEPSLLPQYIGIKTKQKELKK